MITLEHRSVIHDFTSTNFSANVQNQQVGNSQRDLKCYHLTKDGLMFLVMGFTGAKVAKLKIDFIITFNEAQKRLSRTTHPFERQRLMFARNAHIVNT